MSGTLSVSSSLIKARHSTLFCYTLPAQFPPVKALLNVPEINVSVMSPISSTLLRISLLYFCRIGELLQLTVSSVLHPDRAICLGSKRGSSYIIFLPGLSQQLDLAGVSDGSVPLFPITYLKCYRNFVKAGVRFNIPGRKNVPRCHSGRYKVADLIDKGYSLDVLGDLLHHRSGSSILYYITKK